MESINTLTQMEFKNMMGNNSGALWSPAFEADSFDTFVLQERGYGTSITAENAIENRRKVATDLLKELESSQIKQDEPNIEWLDEPMDLEVFGQSIVGTSLIPPYETEFLSLSPSPLSPSVSQPLTPIQPASPYELYPLQDDFAPFKSDEPSIAVPVDSEELLESLELLLHQINAEEEQPVINLPEIIQDEEDITSALLDSLIGIDGNIDESQVVDELAEFSLTLINSNPSERSISSNVTAPTVPIFTASPVQAQIKTDQPSSSERKLTPRTLNLKAAINEPSTAILRKPRKRPLKADDRRLRKKEQNKTAATRYRIKKKAELDILLEEEANLEQRNRHLTIQHDELANEIRYLKKLMREVFTTSVGKRL